jgi:hypothetical protein
MDKEVQSPALGKIEEEGVGEEGEKEEEEKKKRNWLEKCLPEPGKGVGEERMERGRLMGKGVQLDRKNHS